MLLGAWVSQHWYIPFSPRALKNSNSILIKFTILRNCKKVFALLSLCSFCPFCSLFCLPEESSHRHHPITTLTCMNTYPFGAAAIILNRESECQWLPCLLLSSFQMWLCKAFVQMSYHLDPLVDALLLSRGLGSGSFLLCSRLSFTGHL